ncbi:unnamed protein product [Echinostoma caproni]|uniref:Glyco_trans_2-like domain-containing protein n=1 Tax=Echinostoma caproni TaxID=27848 RepID=A0A183A7F5_9TREM|nr:unnamed protein product [Echinostoma caproni]
MSAFRLLALVGKHVRHEKTVKLIRNPQRYGLIKARMVGARAAMAEVLVFLDSHVTCTPKWLEPLLIRMVSFRARVNHTVNTGNHRDDDSDLNAERLIVSPIVFDNKEKGDINRPLYTGGFTWNLTFRWEYPPKPTASHNAAFEPQLTPAISGGIYASWRRAFFEMGGYDEEMNIWGGENIELSLRTWMCHGQMEIIPCSRVGHLFRKKHPYSFPEGIEQTVVKNRKRVALVWLTHVEDTEQHRPQEIKDYLSLFYDASPTAVEVDAGSVLDRKELAKQLNCRSFRWFLTNVYPKLLEEIELNTEQ